MNNKWYAFVSLSIGLVCLEAAGMFPNVPTRYQSSTDLNVKKIEMREELEDVGLAIQEDVSEDNLLRQRDRATIVNRFAEQQDPEMAKRAKLLINQIDGKLRPRPATQTRENLRDQFRRMNINK